MSSCICESMYVLPSVKFDPSTKDDIIIQSALPEPYKYHASFINQTLSPVKLKFTNFNLRSMIPHTIILYYVIQPGKAQVFSIGLINRITVASNPNFTVAPSGTDVDSQRCFILSPKSSDIKA